MMTCTHYISPEGVVTAPGIDYGPKSVRLIYRGPVLSVFQIPGFNGWQSRGQSGHAAASWALCVVRWPENMPEGQPPWPVSPVFAGEALTGRGRVAGVRFEIVRVVEDREPGSRWKACRDAFIGRAKLCLKVPLDPRRGPLRYFLDNRRQE